MGEGGLMAFTKPQFPVQFGRSVQPVKGLDKFERLAVWSMAFVLPAFNGRPFTLSSGFVCLPLALALLMHVSFKDQGRSLVPQHSRLTAALFGGWVLVATVSTVAHPSEETAINLLWGYWTPFLMFLSLIRLKFKAQDFQGVLASFALGLALRFAYGALMFYLEWGIPSLNDLLLARFDIDRMHTYVEATFGNTGNSASVLAISLPVLVMTLLLVPLKKAVRVTVILSVIVITINILITGSRAAILLATTVLMVATFKLNALRRFAMLVVLAISVFLFIFYANIPNTSRLEAVVTVDNKGDASVGERIESINYGLETIRDFPLGVGPGMSRIYNPYHVPHQYAVNQGSDLGILGMGFSAFLGVIVIFRFINFRIKRKLVEGNPMSIFIIGIFGWMLYAMTTNIPNNSGPSIPWIGLFSMFLAFEELARNNAFKIQRNRNYGNEIEE